MTQIFKINTDKISENQFFQRHQRSKTTSLITVRRLSKIKSMKTKNIFAFILIIAASLTGCKKYENGPVISLRSKTERVSNTWKVESYTINGSDYTSILNNINYTETYTKDGKYSYSSSLGSSSGTWEFQSNKMQIKRSGASGQATDLNILRLKEKEFWYYYLDNSDRHEIHLKEK